MGLKENIDRMQEMSRLAEIGGGAERLAKQKQNGRLTARERIDALLDRGSFIKLDKFKTHRITDFEMASNKIPGDGVVAVFGGIDGRQGCVFWHDFMVFGGSHAG